MNIYYLCRGGLCGYDHTHGLFTVSTFMQDSVVFLGSSFCGEISWLLWQAANFFRQPNGRRAFISRELAWTRYYRDRKWKRWEVRENGRIARECGKSSGTAMLFFNLRHIRLRERVWSIYSLLFTEIFARNSWTQGKVVPIGQNRYNFY